MVTLVYPKASRKLTETEQAELVKEVRELVTDAWMYDRENRREAITDLQFLAGDQWPTAVKLARGTNRPMLTINQLPQFVKQVTNPTREADIAIKISPLDHESDPAIAKIYSALIKQIEYESTAKTVYVAGNEHQASCGIGWWQVVTEYVDDAVFDQEIKLRKIENPLAVYCDPAALLPAREDAQWMAVMENWPRKTFKKKWPKAAEVNIDVPDGTQIGDGFSWASKDVVVICMFYKKVPETKRLAQLTSGTVIDITKMGEGELGRIDQQDPILGTREAQSHRVEKYLLNGEEVLEGPIQWAGKYIPLVPVIGAETPQKVGCMRYGVVRFARDPQMMLNFYRTAAAEAIGMAPKTPWLVTDKMIGSHLNDWTTINTENKPFLRYTPDATATATGGMPKREAGPEVPAALLGAAEVASDDMKRVTGIYEASLGQRSNETSGVAISRRQTEGDTANSHFADNLMHSLVHTGRILVDLIPRIYDNERVLQLKDENDKEAPVPINMTARDQFGHPIMGADGKPKIINDLSVGRYKVRVTVGKSYVTKRIEALNAMLEFAKTLPPQAQMLFLDLIVKNSDWPGAEEIAKRLHNMVPQQALADPNDPNAPKPPGPMDNPELVAKLEEMAAKIENLKASARKADADAQVSLAKAGVTDQELQLAGHRQLMEDWSAVQTNNQALQPPPPAPSGAPLQGGPLAAQ